MAKASFSPKKLQIIDIVRSFSILSVVLLHLLQSSAVKRPEQLWVERFWLSVTQNGIYGVFLFFVVSGFLITGMISTTSPSLFHPGFRNFYTRRAGRILPLLTLVLAIGVVMVYGVQAPSPAHDFCFDHPRFDFNFPFWLSILTFSFNWYRIFHEQAAPILGLHWDVLWSLSIEEQFYVFYPLVLSRVKNEKNLTVLLACLIALGPISRFMAFWFDPHRPLLCLLNSFGAFDCIALGVLLFLVSRRFGRFFRTHQRSCWFIGALGFSIMAAVYFGTSLGNPVDRIYGPTAIAIGLFLFLLGGLHLEFFASKKLWILSVPGQVSYGAYLLHASVLYILSSFLPAAQTGISILVYVLAVVGISWISYKYFEIPCNLWIRRKLSGLKITE